MASFRQPVRLLHIFAVCAVCLVFYMNWTWHISQASERDSSTSSVPTKGNIPAVLSPRIQVEEGPARSVSDMVKFMEARSAVTSSRTEPPPVSVLDQPKEEVSLPIPVQNSIYINGPSVAKKQLSHIHAVTYASHGGRDDRFCRAVESALQHDIDLVILGWGVKWQGLSQKLEASHAYAAALPADDVMLFTDAFDVMFTNSSENILKIFDTMNTDILFAGECGCWPHVMEKNARPCFDDYPKAPTPYRYLNSGTWIAKAGSAKGMLLAVIEEAGKNFANANDQKLVADMYIQGRFGIKLDFYSEIFQSMHMTLSKPLPRCDPTKDVQIIHGHFHNQLTNTNPSVFHFNGGGKSVHLDMEKSIWYKSPQYNTPEARRRLAERLISIPLIEEPNRAVRFDGLCPSYFDQQPLKRYQRNH